MHRVFESFVYSLSESVDAQDLRNSFSQVAAAFDLRCFAYLSMPSRPGAEADLISTYPSDWTAHYLRNHYERLDPIVQRAHKDPEPFDWGREIGPARISRRQQEFFGEAAEFGIRYGFTVPIHDRNGRVAALSFAVDERSSPFRRCVERKVDALQLLASLLHTHACRVMSGDRVVNGISLTPRQLECLEWAARGKSMSDIGCILGISSRTVTFHIESAKAKLGVRTICQAVALLAASKPNIR